METTCEVKLTSHGPKGAWTYILIPFDAAKRFGMRGLIPVADTINGFAFRSSLAPEGEGRHYVAINKQMLTGAGVAAGDTVKLVLQPDKAERTVDVPPELKAALQTNAEAGRLFAGLAYSCRKEYALWIAGAKRQETRDSRASKAVAMLLKANAVPTPEAPHLHLYTLPGRGGGLGLADAHAHHRALGCCGL